MSGPMGLVYETPGDPSTTDVWGTALNASLTLIENHDHTSGKGSLIKAASLGIDADTPWGAFALTLAKAITFTEQAPAAMTPYSSALFASSADHNLYWRNSSGTNVQITAGAQLNLSAVGGIGGDYASVSALADFTDATHTYGLHQQIGGGVRQYGKLATGDVSIFEFKVNPTTGVPVFAVTLKSPTALAASYAVTWPAAVPAQAAPLTIDASGVLHDDGVFGTNQNLQLQGTGYIKRGSRTYTWPIMPTLVSVTGGSVSTAGSGVGATVNASTTAYFPIQVPNADNDAITVTQVKVYHSVAGTGTVTWELDVSGQLSIAGFGPVTGASATGFSSPITLTPTTPIPGTSTQVLWLKVVTPGTASGVVVQVVVTTTVP